MTDGIGRTVPIDTSQYNSLLSFAAQTSVKTSNHYHCTNEETSAGYRRDSHGTYESLARLDPNPALGSRQEWGLEKENSLHLTHCLVYIAFGYVPVKC